MKINLTKQLYKLGKEDTRLKPTGTILFKKKIEIKPLYLHCKSSYICIFLERKDRTGGYRQIRRGGGAYEPDISTTVKL